MKENKERVIDLFETKYQETTSIGDDIYSTAALREDVKNEEILKVPIAAIDFNKKPWDEITNIWQFCYHYAICEDIDNDEPIILGPDGGIIDGNHRVCRALIKGEKYIYAQQLKKFPEPICVKKDNK